MHEGLLPSFPQSRPADSVESWMKFCHENHSTVPQTTFQLQDSVASQPVCTLQTQGTTLPGTPQSSFPLDSSAGSASQLVGSYTGPSSQPSGTSSGTGRPPSTSLSGSGPSPSGPPPRRGHQPSGTSPRSASQLLSIPTWHSSSTPSSRAGPGSSPSVTPSRSGSQPSASLLASGSQPSCSIVGSASQSPGSLPSSALSSGSFGAVPRGSFAKSGSRLPGNLVSAPSAPVLSSIYEIDVWERDSGWTNGSKVKLSGGLDNVSLNCYLSSLLQSLRHCNGFTDLIVDLCRQLSSVAPGNQTLSSVNWCKEMGLVIENMFVQEQRFPNNTYECRTATNPQRLIDSMK